MAFHALVRLVLVTIVLLLCATSCSAQVAPQDANPGCLSTSLSMPNDPSNDPTQKVLLDTQYYLPQTLVTILGVSGLWLNLNGSSGNEGVNKIKYFIYIVILLYYNYVLFLICSGLIITRLRVVPTGL